MSRSAWLPGRFLLIENKVDSPLGHQQLEHYLQIRNEEGSPAFVALFGQHQHAVSAAVLRSDNYKRPNDRDHYLWLDFFEMLPAPENVSLGTSALRTSWREYMAYLGFAPTNLKGEWQRLFEDGVDPANGKVQVEFGHRLAEARKYLTDRGFKVTSVSHRGLQARPRQPEPYLFIKIKPVRAALNLLRPEDILNVDGAVLAVELVDAGGDAPYHERQLASRLSAPVTDATGRCWYPTLPTAFNHGSRTGLRFVSPLQWFLESESEIGSRLGASCRSILETVLTAASSIPLSDSTTE